METEKEPHMAAVIETPTGFTLVLDYDGALGIATVSDERGDEPVLSWFETSGGEWACLALWRALRRAMAERGVVRLYARVFDERLARVARACGWRDDSTVLRLNAGVEGSHGG